jgi:uncharacterized membrane protein YgcG
MVKNGFFYHALGTASLALGVLAFWLVRDYSLKWNLIYVADVVGYDPALVLQGYTSYRAGTIGFIDMLFTLPTEVLALGLMITFSAFVVWKIIPQPFVSGTSAVFMTVYVLFAQGVDLFTNISAMGIFNDVVAAQTQFVQDAQLQIIVVDGSSYMLSVIATFADDLMSFFVVGAVWCYGMGLKEMGMFSKLPAPFRSLFSVEAHSGANSVVAKVFGQLKEWYNDITSTFSASRNKGNTGRGNGNTGGGGSTPSGGGGNPPAGQPPARGGGGNQQSFNRFTPPQ